MPVNLKRYPPWWTHDITVYNRHLDDDGAVAWHRTQLSRCFFAGPRSTAFRDNGKQDADTYVCRIPESNEYLSPAAWAASADKSQHFTLFPEDIVVLGHIPELIDESGAAGLHSSDLLVKYARVGAFRVSVAAENTGVMVGSPHYKALGGM